MARPKIKIDANDLLKLAVLHCTNQEIADFFECSKDTIERRFAAILKKGRAQGKIKLRRAQWQSVDKGNVVAQIWLGKQILGQTEKIEQSLDADINHEVILMWPDEDNT